MHSCFPYHCNTSIFSHCIQYNRNKSQNSPADDDIIPDKYNGIITERNKKYPMNNQIITFNPTKLHNKYKNFFCR